MSNNAKVILEQLTLEEKASLLSGKDFWHLKGIERVGLPEIMVTDGPHGLRKQDGESDHVGLNQSVKATCFPTAVGLAASWDKKLVEEVGEALGDECLTEEVSVLLGPGANIKRHPLCGRNFEYFSEDPVLSGKMAASLITGIQSKGVGTSIKHYVANNQESMRMAVDTFVDERTLREIYLKGFEIAVKESQPWTVMCSYNKLNGTYLSEHKRMLQDVLKDEWGHEGIVVTDWGACNNRVDGLIAGQELEMPSSNGINDRKIVEAVKNGTLSESIVDKRALRIIELILKSKETLSKKHKPYNKEEHHEFARKVAANTICLLKNDDILPLSKSNKVALIGEFAKTPRYQGSGSSLIQPTKISNAYNAFKAELGDNLQYAQGYSSKDDIIDQTLIDEAIKVAKSSDVVVLMIGLTDLFESEGFDRKHLNIPNNHLKLVEEISKVNENIIVALSNGSPITMPWKDKVKGILEQYLGGQASGEALADVVFGKVNPSGKLAETFPNNLEEFASNENFPGLPRQVEYREGLYVGYRYYDKTNKSPLYPFGYGLSYTTFEYSELNVKVGKTLNVSYKITNTGKISGKEVSQVYVSKSDSNVHRPEKELKAFDKTEIEPGETVTINHEIPLSDLEIYIDNFTLEDGKYDVKVGSSSVDILLSKEVKIKGVKVSKTESVYDSLSKTGTITQEQFEKELGFKIPDYPSIRPFTLNSVMSEIEVTFVGKKLKQMITKEMNKMLGTEESNDAVKAMMESMVNELPLRGLMMLGGEAFSENRALGLLDILNKKYIRGTFKLLKK